MVQQEQPVEEGKLPKKEEVRVYGASSTIPLEAVEIKDG